MYESWRPFLCLLHEIFTISPVHLQLSPPPYCYVPKFFETKLICYTPSFFSYIKAIHEIHNILTVNNKIPISCKTVLLTGQQFIDLLPAIELYFHWFNKSRDIDVTMSRRRPEQNSYRLTSRTTAVLFDPAASGNRSILGSNKTAVVLESSQ